MAVTLKYAHQATVEETITVGTPFAKDSLAKVTHNLLNQSGTLNASSTPPVTKVGSDEDVEIYGGIATIDLTDLIGTNGAAVDGTGLKVQHILIVANEDNYDPITVEPGASNGYELKGASWSEDLDPGDIFQLTKIDTAPDVASGAKNIDFTGTDGDTFSYIVVLG